ncbi:MAG: right-handed parallel beta-helix repeat-containing protein [Lentisphaerae bacterium]|nr:right-handed parallel beta-helix repeat-containing protein [Lentisphaerota bacterium]
MTSLEPSHHFVVNNHIHHYARWKRIYQSGVQIEGVGIRVANNHIHDAPHMAISFHGNEHIIELNEINNVVYESFDAGAVYSGRNPSMQGNIIRHNYFHNIGKIAEYHGVASVYLDDGQSGISIYGNIFYKACVPGGCKFGAVFVHGGRYNNIENNIFIDCPQAYNETPWTQEFWLDYWAKPMYKERLFGDKVDVRKKPYTEKYPWLANVLEDQRPNILARNIAFNCKSFTNRGVLELTDNMTEEDPLFVDYEKGDFRLRAESPAFKKGFQPIPVEKIGLLVDDNDAVTSGRK